MPSPLQAMLADAAQASQAGPDAAEKLHATAPFARDPPAGTLAGMGQATWHTPTASRP